MTKRVKPNAIRGLHSLPAPTSQSCNLAAISSLRSPETQFEVAGFARLCLLPFVALGGLGLQMLLWAVNGL